MQINKLIFYTIFETILLTALIFSTYFIWNTFEEKTIFFAYNNQKNTVTLQIENKIELLTRNKDTKAINENNKIIMYINNNGKIKKQYYTYLKVNEETNLDTKYLKISLNEEIKYLYTLENFTKNNERYYIISKGIINDNEKITQDIYLWLSEETPQIEENKIYNFEINVEEM